MSKEPAEGSESQAPEDQDVDVHNPLGDEGEGEGIELTMGAPTSFEPEEDPGSGGNTGTA